MPTIEELQERLTKREREVWALCNAGLLCADFAEAFDCDRRPLCCDRGKGIRAANAFRTLSRSIEIPPPRTEMKCRICGCFSSAQTCWHCTTNPAAARVAELERENALLRAWVKDAAARIEDAGDDNPDHWATSESRTETIKWWAENLREALATLPPKS